MNSLSENIFRLRSGKGMSQGELAEELEVSRQSVSKWENEQAVPELDKLIRMSRLFGVTLDELVYGKRREEPKLTQIVTAPVRPLPSAQVMAGAVFLLFGLVFLLLSVFWGDRLAMGEEVGEIVSVLLVLGGVAMMGTYNRYVLAVSSVVYFLYALASYRIFHINSVSHHLFLGIAGLVLFGWFLIWCHRMEKEQREEKEQEGRGQLAQDH